MERDLALMHIARGTFIPFSYTVREFYEYWFYHHMIGEKRISYNTYTSYRSILNNHILPVIGHQKLDCLQRKDLIRALRKIPSRNVQRTAIGMISGSLRYAQERSYFPVNIYSGLNYELKKSGLFQKEILGGIFVMVNFSSKRSFNPSGDIQAIPWLHID